MSSLSYPGSSTQSLPRSWDSPEQPGPTPWVAATERLYNPSYGLNQRLSGPYLAGNHSSDMPTSYPADAVHFALTQRFHVSEAGSHGLPGGRYSATPDAGAALSNCTTPADPPSPRRDQQDAQVCRKTGAQAVNCSVRKTSPPRDTSDGSGKKEEPYSQLIFRALMSTPRRAMTLQEIYRWFRENTNKGEDDSKGWQKSIRYNLSMNNVRPALPYSPYQVADPGSLRPSPSATPGSATLRTLRLTVAPAAAAT